MEPTEVRRRLDVALKRFNQKDGHLLENNLHECCLAGRLAMYLQSEFQEYFVDTEYSRDGGEPKKLRLDECCTKHKLDETGKAFVRPDIVVHCRGEKGPNLLVLEMKKATNQTGHECDRKRIKAFRSEYDYSFGATIDCTTGLGGYMYVSRWFDVKAPDGDPTGMAARLHS